MSVNTIDRGSAPLLTKADVWNEYLHETRGQPEARYIEIEPWAWSRLRSRLAYIKRRDKMNKKKPGGKKGTKGPY